tara:strand:- start:117 stop:356 length:240 start_codon:yes stop_codon:yes gene_type:complete
MATKKNTTKLNQGKNPSEEEVNTLINNSFEAGKKEGSQEVWKGLASFLATRMHSHFENHQDDLARELREILLALKKNIT